MAVDPDPNDTADPNDAAPTVEVRAFRHGELIGRELVESEEQAALVVDRWSELEGVTCEVDDLSVLHRPGQVFEPAEAYPTDEDYPEAVADDGPSR